MRPVDQVRLVLFLVPPRYKMQTLMGSEIRHREMDITSRIRFCARLASPECLPECLP